ncbi:unnamed protein product, partial [Polarella glacialis]
EWINGARPMRFYFQEGSRRVTWSRALVLMTHSDLEFRRSLTALLRDRVPFAAFLWECSPVDDGSEIFECVVQEARLGQPVSYGSHPGIIGGATVIRFVDPSSGDEVVMPTGAQPERDVLIFRDHLRRMPHSSYSDLASFLRSDLVPASQKDQLWADLGRAVSGSLTTQGGPLWVANDRRASRLIVRVRKHPGDVLWDPYRRKPTQSAARLKQSLAEANARRFGGA